MFLKDGFTTKKGGKIYIYGSGDTDYSTNILDTCLAFVDTANINILKEIVSLHECVGEIDDELIEKTNELKSQLVLEKGIVYRDYLKAKKNGIVYTRDNTSNNPPTETKSKLTTFDSELAISTCNMLIKFFYEFNYIPSARFINQLLHTKNKREYVKNYFELMNYSYKDSIVEKIKSYEFDTIVNNLNSLSTDKTINNRLVVYFGAAGSGKTTQAIKIAQRNALAKGYNAKILVCHATMLPSDLLEEFDFMEDSGKPKFKKSSLRLAMENGETIVLDEINLLNMECLRTLQGYVDSKETVNFKDETITIHKDFQIIGTMNLYVNGKVFELPEPLVDRCVEINSFVPTAKMLVDFAF